MPTYSIQGPDGKTYNIEGPEGATREQVIAKIKEKQQPSSAEDAARSFGRGVTQGAIGLAGLPGDISTALNRGIDYIEDFIAPSGSKPKHPDYANPLGSENIQRQVEKAAGKFDTPKTTAGKYAQSIGEFVPSMLAGPESLAVKAGGAVLGGAASEAAGELTAGTKFETPARIAAGALGAGFAPTKYSRGAELETSEGIKKAAQDGYLILEQAPHAITPAGMADLQASVRKALRQENYGPRTASTTYGLLEDTNNPNLNNKPARIKDVVDIHEEMGHVSPQVNAKDAAASQVARRAVRDWLIKNVPGVDKTLTEALGNWSAYKKIEEVETALDWARHRAAVSGTGTNVQNTMRQEIRKILDNAKRIRGYSQAAQDQMEKIIEGTVLENLSRFVGRFAPVGLHSTVGAALISQLANSPLFFVGSVGAYGAKKLGDLLTHQEIERLVTILQEDAPVNRLAGAANRAARAQASDTSIALSARGGVAGYEQPRSPADELANPSGIPLQ